MTAPTAPRTDDIVLDPVERAIADIAAGRPVVVVDDEDRENEGDIVLAAEHATPERIAFMMTEARGLICAPLAAADVDRLDLPQMAGRNDEPLRTAFTVSVDAAPVHGTSTGISAADRARTLRMLADPAYTAGDFVRPGHVFPLRARPGGVLERRGHTEASVDLARLAGLRPAAVICEIANDDGTMARLPDLVLFARKHGLTLISIEDLAAHRRASRDHRVPAPAPHTAATPAAEAPAADAPAAESPTVPAPAPVRLEAVTRLPTTHGDFRAHGYRAADGVEHIALVAGDLGDGHDVLVRLHSECLTGDVLGSQRCDCGPQLAFALDRIAAEGRGVLVYLRGHEGRGIGLLHKLRAYELQERGRDTLDANLELGLPADARDYGAGARILADLGVRSLRLLTNNPGKADALAAHGLRVIAREPAPVRAGEHNVRYLRTKRDRMGHDLPWLDAGPAGVCGNQ